MRAQTLASIYAAGFLAAACAQGPVPRAPLPAEPTCAGLACVTEFTIPSPGAAFGEAPKQGDSVPYGIVAGPDGAVWFHEGPAGKIGRMAADGKVTEFTIPGATTAPSAQGFLGAGTDGSVWFTVDPPANLIGRVAAGKVSTYPIPTPSARARAVVPTPDGAVWFTEAGPGTIGRLGRDGKITELPLPGGATSNPLGMALGADGALWVVEGGSAAIVRVALDGSMREFHLPDPKASALRIIAGPDRAMWFNEFGADRIGRITLDGQITEYPLTPGSGPVSGTVGPDGALYWTALKSGKVLRVTRSGQPTQWWDTPTLRSGPYHIVTARDGALWFTEHDANRIGRLQLFGAPKQRPAGAGTVSSGGSVPGASMAGPVMPLPPPPPADAPIGVYTKVLQSSNGYNQGRWRFELYPDASCKFTYLEPGGVVMPCTFTVQGEFLTFPGGPDGCQDGVYRMSRGGGQLTLVPVAPDLCGGSDHGRQQVVSTGPWSQQ